MGKKTLVDASFNFEAETEKAIKVNEGGESFWLPKSQIEYEVKGTAVEVTMPLWLAQEKSVAGY